MPGVARVTDDTAGGTQLGGNQHWVYIDDTLVVVRGDDVLSHPPCPQVPAHCAAVMVGASSWVYIDDRPICRAGDLASCGHPSTGSDWVESS